MYLISNTKKGWELLEYRRRRGRETTTMGDGRATRTVDEDGGGGVTVTRTEIDDPRTCPSRALCLAPARRRTRWKILLKVSRRPPFSPSTPNARSVNPTRRGRVRRRSGAAIRRTRVTAAVKSAHGRRSKTFKPWPIFLQVICKA